LRLFAKTFEQPRADTEVTSVDFVSRGTQCSPFLLSITLDRNADPMRIFRQSNRHLIEQFWSHRDDRHARQQLLDSWRHLWRQTDDASLKAALTTLWGKLVAGADLPPVYFSEAELRHLTPPTPMPPPDEITSQTWRYWDQGQLPAANWHQVEYDDSSWSEGPAPLGYGESGLGTTIDFGGDAAKKHITTRFRQSVNLDSFDPQEFVLLSVTRDDGVAVYLNGQELVRDNLPANATPSTPAELTTEPETLYWIFPGRMFRAGKNLIAAEVHQQGPTSSDVFFQLRLMRLRDSMPLDEVQAVLQRHQLPLPDEMLRWLYGNDR
jgi:hypothetical protein